MSQKRRPAVFSFLIQSYNARLAPITESTAHLGCCSKAMKTLIEMEVLFVVVVICFTSVVVSVTDPGDLAILEEFRKGLDNAELLQWPAGNQDPCGLLKLKFVICNGPRVTQIQVQGMALNGTLPPDFNKLTELNNLGLQRNYFRGKLPSFSGLSSLEYAYLGENQFDTIPSDFFVGLTSLRVLSLDKNPLNESTGWQIPLELEKSAQLTNLSLMTCNLVGPIPDFLGSMASLTNLKLSYNSLTGEIPASFSGALLEILWLNDQKAPGLTGSISTIATMTMLNSAWLHGNSFSGPIPNSIGNCVSLKDLALNGNQLVGLIPANLTTLPQLQSLRLENNLLMGPIPKVNFNFTYEPNSFCQGTPGVSCSSDVTALLDFLSSVNYPSTLATDWSGNDPCTTPWLGVACPSGKVSRILLSNWKLNGSISPSLGKLADLVTIRLDGNNLTGTIPETLASLKSLQTLNVSDNNFAPPVPKFNSGMKIITSGNPLIDFPGTPLSPPPSDNPSSPDTPLPPGSRPSPTSNVPGVSKSGNSVAKKLIVVVPIIAGVFIIALVVLLVCFRRKGKKGTVKAPSSVVIHPRLPSDPDNMVKIAVANNVKNSVPSSDFGSSARSPTGESHLIDAGNIVISVQILRRVTHNFSPKNELGRGGFGVVYKGELHDGTQIAVKRMEATVVSNKALDEFQSEIAVLSKVRHRNLVSLLGYSVEANERLLVYEYMPQGALNSHLFRWKHLKIEPLTWKRRLVIALDVARAMEYLHSLAHQSFIHRDLKSSNILLGDDFRAKVSDFGLVKLAPDGKSSVTTRLAGTFGYMAPEYAVTGKITTKVDVFSFGVVLMEIMTGLIALDEDRPEEKRYLVSWFFQIMSSSEQLKAAIDPSLDVTDEIFDSISIIAELAGHCAAREPNQRPDMGHAVNVLAPLVEKWKPMTDDLDDYLGLDLRQPLLQMVKGWQAADGSSINSTGLDDSKGSIPARPAGFADSFTSADGR